MSVPQTVAQDKKWVYTHPADEQTVMALAKSINVNPYLAAVLTQRGVTDYDLARAYFRPNLDELHDPFKMTDMAKAVERLNEALFNKQNVLIYGDYDVDGTTAVALLYLFLTNHGHDSISYYVPDRYDEGYGISETGIRWAADHDMDLVIALDCGIKAIDNARLAKDLGIDLIICDHHLPGPELPEAFAILDPKREDCHYPFDGLSGCGVGFKLLQAFCEQNTIDQTALYQYLDLVAVSIASDLVPLCDENRIMAHYGLKKLETHPLIGLKALKHVSGLSQKEMDIQGIVFGIGPRINAAGRIDHAKSAVQLLTCNNATEAKALASQVNDKNTRRKDYDRDITLEALEAIANDPIPDKKSTVLYDEQWHKGVIGIVASRCIEQYYRPTIILTQSNGKATGSARSVAGFDIYEAIASCSNLLDQYGGHRYAAGLTLPLSNLEAFQKQFEQVVQDTISEKSLQPVVHIDLELPLSMITFKFNQVLQQMAPFGPRNREPVFSSNNLVLVGEPRIMKEVHMKFYVRHREGKMSYEVLAFNMAHLKEQIQSASCFHLAYHLQHTTFRGEKSLQLNVKDIHFD